MLALLGCNTGCVVIYFLIYLFFINKAFINLKDLPYSSMRMANLTLRLQARLPTYPAPAAASNTAAVALQLPLLLHCPASQQSQILLFAIAV